MVIRELVNHIQDFAPLKYQENYDNSGLLIGDWNNEITGVLISIDVTEAVVHEAIRLKCNLILAHHPLIFKPLKSITGKNDIERCVSVAIKHDIAVYASHTNLDSVRGGVSYKMAEKLELQNLRCLSNTSENLNKIVCFVPVSHADVVRNAMFDAGGGKIGNYDRCSFNISGNGTYRPGEGSHPFIGIQGETHTEPEIRIETIVPDHLLNRVVTAMIKSHPYEEVAYDVFKLKNENSDIGLGVIGELQQACTFADFIKNLKKVFRCETIRCSEPLNKPIKRIAVCGGSGSGFIPTAINAGADVYITGEIGYHQFFQGENKIILIDIGHYESEQFTKEIFYDLVSKINPKFAVRFSEINTNPIKFY